MALPDQHLAFMLAHQVSLTDAGRVVWAGTTLDATFDDADEVISDTAGGQVVEGGRVLQVRAAALPTSARRDDLITVDGEQYQVKNLLRQDDGKRVLVWVAPVTA